MANQAFSPGGPQMMGFFKIGFGFKSPDRFSSNDGPSSKGGPKPEAPQAQAQAQSGTHSQVQAEQQALQRMQLEIQAKVQRGEMSPEEGQKNLQAAQQRIADLQATLAPTAAGSSGGGAAAAPPAVVDTFEPAPAKPPPVTISADPLPQVKGLAGLSPEVKALLDRAGGGGSKPGLGAGSGGISK